jgi:RNA polymerase sigma-70 factor (ECF subfamily)
MKSLSHHRPATELRRAKPRLPGNQNYLPGVSAGEYSGFSPVFDFATTDHSIDMVDGCDGPKPLKISRPVGTIENFSRQKEADRMSAKAQEVAIDRILVDRFKSGDQGAFDEMVGRYWDRIYSMVHQLLRNQQDAEEVTQDAFVRAHRGLVNFRGDSSFSTWLYQIATNLARNRYWYWWRRKRDKSISFEAPISGDSDTTFAEIFPAEVETPEDAAVTQEFLGRVAAAMEEISQKHREILIFRNVQNLAYEEIAEVLKITVGTVKSRIARARESLRQKLGGETI